MKVVTGTAWQERVIGESRAAVGGPKARDTAFGLRLSQLMVSPITNPGD